MVRRFHNPRKRFVAPRSERIDIVITPELKRFHGLLEEKLQEDYDWGTRKTELLSKGVIKEEDILTEEKFAQHFSEIDVTLDIEDIANEHPELRIDLRPPIMTRGGMDGVGYNGAGRLVVEKGNKDSENYWVYDYDFVFRTGTSPEDHIGTSGLLTLVELTLGSWRGSVGNKTKQRLRPQKFFRRLKPLGIYFDSKKIGFIYILSADLYSTKAQAQDEESPIGDVIKTFYKHNGLLLSYNKFPSRDAFVKNMKQQLEEVGDDQYRLKSPKKKSDKLVPVR
ncbi:hypothetical protein KY332_01630 [Candidatus Woesearchaeota archaeon]|nr:hypothetical protein [Candidatus Woesearchaeota archaeon]